MKAFSFRNFQFNESNEERKPAYFFLKQFSNNKEHGCDFVETFQALSILEKNAHSTRIRRHWIQDEIQTRRDMFGQD